MPNSHRITIPRNGLPPIVRDLPFLALGPTTSIAILNILGDWELCEAVGSALVLKLLKSNIENIEAMIMPDGKAQALLHILGTVFKVPTVVARKEHKPYMGLDPITASVRSATNEGRYATLYLSLEDAAKIKGKRTLIVDDVVSTGSSLRAVQDIMVKAGAIPAGVLAAFTEGDKRDDVLSLGHLPHFNPDGTPKL